METKLLRKVRRKYAIYRIDTRKDGNPEYDWIYLWAKENGFDCVYCINNDLTIVYDNINEALSDVLELVRKKYKRLGKNGRRRKAVPVREKVWYNS